MADLISRDYLREIVGGMPTGWEYGAAVSDIYDIIMKAPTIDAIPVEWIMSWSNKRYMETHRDVSIVDVLEAWQKEQEAR